MPAAIEHSGVTIGYGPEGQFAQGYDAAAYARKNGLVVSNSTADAAQRYDRDTCIAVSRDLHRNNWLYRGAIGVAADYVVGPIGFPLQAKTGVDGLNKRIENELWPAIAESPEIRMMFDLAALTRIVFNDLFVVGDTFATKLGGADDGKLQHLEGERFRKTTFARENGYRWEQGAKLNKKGQVVAWMPGDGNDWGYISATNGPELAEKNVFHIKSPFDRTSATRGMPAFTSSMPHVHRLDDILTSEAIGWQVASRLVASITPGEKGGRAPLRKGANATENSSSDADKQAIAAITEMGHAVIYQARHPGDKIDLHAHQRPTSKLAESVKLFVRLFSVPCGIPPEAILRDWGSMNYSSSRATLLQAFVTFRRWQQVLVGQFLSRIYRWHVARWLRDGVVKWRPSIWNHQWDVPGWPWIDEDKEVSAWIKKIDHGIGTQTQALAGLQMDVHQFREDRKKEILEAWRVAQEIQEETRGEIPAASLWRTLAGLSEGKTERAVQAAKEDAPDLPTDDSEPEDDNKDQDDE